MTLVLFCMAPRLMLFACTTHKSLAAGVNLACSCSRILPYPSCPKGRLPDFFETRATVKRLIIGVLIASGKGVDSLTPCPRFCAGRAILCVQPGFW